MKQTARSALQAVTDSQVATNRKNLQWAEAYAGHRAQLTAALLDAHAAPATARLCLLGAGNCQDVDLAALAVAYREVHLVDIDAVALAGAVKPLAGPLRSKVYTHAPVDLTGLLGQVDRWRGKPPTLAQLLAGVSTAAGAIAARLPRPFEVVASCCVMTQLYWGLGQVLGYEHPALADVQQVAAAIHWRSMREACVAPGGSILFVTDVVSNETFPLESLEPGADLGAVRDRLMVDGNCFRGGDLAFHARLLRVDEALRVGLERPDALPPWLWWASEERVFLVQAWRVRTRA